MSRCSLQCAVLVLAASAAFAQQQSVVDQDWQLFRKAYPYHIQAVALSDERPDGSRTLIIAEPPPHVTLEGLRGLKGEVFADPLLRTTKVGYDGWVKDVVVTLRNAHERETRALVDRLNIYLFGTAYKSYALRIAPEGPLPEPRPLNLRVSAADLDRWLFRSTERFVPHSGGHAIPISAVLQAGSSGLYYSEEPGVVALVAPKTQLGAMRRQLRAFALDSDLILGATASHSRVAIFARERAAPVDVLPPLRTETILLLAAAAPKLAELSQSYERKNFFAGHMDQVGWDWAQVYLSDCLIDTEYGSLLNITDQLLKSWSSNGQVEYYHFPYPAPSSWPFKAPIILDANVRQVTFNWNTRGAGYSIDFPNTTGFRRIFSLNRTGALPVNYIPAQLDSTGENPLAKYEVTGYEYFAGLSDPNLVRVVQYAALYQVFHEFGVADNLAGVFQQPHPEWDLLAEIGAKITDLLLSPEADNIVAKLKPDYRAKAAEDLRQLQRSVNRAKAAFGDGILTDIGLRLANPRLESTLQTTLASGARSRDSLTATEIRALTAHALARQVMECQVGRLVQSVIGGSDKIYQKYATATSTRSTGWIRTASIVVSRTTGSMAKDYYGGHNLDSRIVRYRLSSELKPGEVRVLQEGSGKVVLLSPGDVDRVPGVLRKAALTGRDEDLPRALAAELKRVMPLPPRPRDVALDLKPQWFALERGLATDKPGSRLALLGGWKPESAMPPASANPAAAFSRLGTRAIAIEKADDFSFKVFVPGDTRPRVALSYDAALDNVIDAMKTVDGPAGAWNLQLTGFDRTEARNFLRTAEVQFAGREKLQLAGFTAGEKMAAPEMLRVLGAQYDFRRAVIRDAVVEEENLIRPGTKALRFDMEIPAIRAARPPLSVRIRLFFRTHVSEPVKLAVESALRRIVGGGAVVQQGTASGMPTGEKILLDLRRDLKRMRIPEAQHLDFDIEVTTEAGDFYVAENRPNGSRQPA